MIIYNKIGLPFMPTLSARKKLGTIQTSTII